MNIRLTNEEVDAINELIFKKASKGSNNHQSLMERASLEDDLADWMEDNGIEDGFEFAETFAEYCFKTEDLDFIKEHVKTQHEEFLISFPLLKPTLIWTEVLKRKL